MQGSFKFHCTRKTFGRAMSWQITHTPCIHIEIYTSPLRCHRCLVFVIQCTHLFSSSLPLSRSSGRSSRTSTASIPMATIMASRICSTSASMSTTTRQAAASMCPAPCSLIWSQAPWTRCVSLPWVNSSGPITLSTDSREQVRNCIY